MNKNSLWKKLIFISAIFVTSIIITLTYSHQDQSVAETEIAETEIAKVKSEVDWEYSGAYNASRWGELSPEFETCQLGRDQSPINLDDPDSYQPGELAEIEFDYQSSKVEVINNSHTVVVNYEPGSKVKINNKEYELLQFHFHTPSEHTIENKASAMEVHFVHKNETGKLAVVGVMMNSGAENPLIARIWDMLPDGSKAKTKAISLNAADLLPNNKNYLSYEGSLTTPPCSEGVSWNVLLEPIEVSPEQVESFGSLHPYNARPIQPINGRSIELRQDN